MSTRSEIDQVWNQMQQGVRRMRPLVVEQQPERDMRFPKPAMVVQERCSRSSYLERMEKYWTERWIEIALAGGTSMEEIEEIRALVNYDRPVRTLVEERKARLEMLEECRRMIEREDEEDEAKKHHEIVSLVAGDSDPIVSHDGGFVESVCVILEPNKLKTLQEDYCPESETFLLEEDNSSEREMDVCASQVFDQIPKRRKKVAKKKKRWKLFADAVKDLEETFTGEGKDNLLLGMQMENTSKSQRKSLLKWCRGVSCQWVHTHQRFNRKWLLIFRKKKRKLEMAEENYGSCGKLEKYRETARDVLRNMARELQSHVLKDAAENRGKNRNVEMKIDTSPSFGRRLLLLNITKKKKETTRLDQQEKKRTWPGKLEGQRVHSNKGGVNIGSLRETKKGNEMKRSKLELEQLKLMQEHNKALKKLKKWMKHKFKQKNKKGSIKLDGAVMKINKLLAATMREREELRFECIVQGKLLPLDKIGWTKLVWEWKKRKKKQQTYKTTYCINALILGRMLMKQSLISCKRAELRMKLRSNGLRWVEMLSRPRRTGKKKKFVCREGIYLTGELISQSGTVESEGSGEEQGIYFRVMELHKVTKTVMRSDSWMRDSSTPNMNTEKIIKEASRHEFRTEPFETSKLRIFSWDWMHSPRPPELPPCSSHETAIQDCRGASSGITLVEKLSEARKGSMIKNFCCCLVQDSVNHIMEVKSRLADAKYSGVEAVLGIYYVTPKLLSLTLSSAHVILEKLEIFINMEANRQVNSQEQDYTNFVSIPWDQA